MLVDKELIKMVTDFNRWLTGQPPPETVEEIQKYWKDRKTEYGDKVMALYNEKLNGALGVKRIGKP